MTAPARAAPARRQPERAASRSRFSPSRPTPAPGRAGRALPRVGGEGVDVERGQVGALARMSGSSASNAATSCADAFWVGTHIGVHASRIARPRQATARSSASRAVSSPATVGRRADVRIRFHTASAMARTTDRTSRLRCRPAAVTVTAVPVFDVPGRVAARREPSVLLQCAQVVGDVVSAVHASPRTSPPRRC